MKDKYDIIGYYEGITLLKKLDNNAFYIVNRKTKTVLHSSFDRELMVKMFVMYLATYVDSEYKVGA